MYTQDKMKQYIQASSKAIKAETVIKNGKIVDVFNGEIIEADVAIEDGIIVGIGEFEGKTTIDAKGQYICPGLVDAHVHIESSLVSPTEFAKVVLPHGVTSVITDPHEIANVSGEAGIHYMLADSENSPLDVYFMLPSSVPATPYENNGATLEAEHLQPFLLDERVLGLAEVMDFPAVKNVNPSMLTKLRLTPMKDGHGAGLDQDGINIYRTAGIRTDHEATSAQEAKERLQRGMHLLIREGSVAKDLKQLLPAVTHKNVSRCMFCTDDKHLDDLIREGSIDHNVRLAIGEGMDPIMAITMGSYNAANCYGLGTKGAIAPGFEADLFFAESLEDLTITAVYKKGILVAESGSYLENDYAYTHSSSTSLTSTVHIQNVTKEQLQIPIQGSKAFAIEIVPNSLLTKKLVVDIKEDYFLPSTEKDLLKLAVIERHHATGNVGLSIVKGFNMKKGAIATTIAHDSHNIVVAGTNDEDMLTAISELERMQGGLIYIVDGVVKGSLSLPIAGLFSNEPFEDVKEKLVHLKSALLTQGIDPDFNPFLTLSFLTLPVIPQLKLTDKGLFDVDRFEHITIDF